MRAPPAPLPTPAPMMAAMPTMAAAMPAAMATPPLLLAMPSLTLLHMPTMDPRQEPRRKEEDHIHDPQAKTPLQHPARLADTHVPPPGHTQPELVPQRPELQIHARPGLDGRTVGGGDEAEEVDSRDERAGKGQVDDGDEARVGGGPVVAEEREDGPGECQRRDDEHEQDGGGRHEVGVEVQVHEVGEHAHYGDLGCG